MFLTPKGIKPNDHAEQEAWTTMSYTDVLRLVEGTIESKSNSAKEDVVAFLRQYASTLRRNIVPEVSNDVHELAKRIYRKHKEAIDLIFEHRARYEPNYVTEGFRMIRDAIGKQALWKEGTSNHPYARFVSADWEKYEELKLKTWPFNLLHFEVQVTGIGASLVLSMGRSENEVFRKKIFNCIEENPDTFKGKAPVYSNYFFALNTMCNILNDGDYENWWDEDAIRSKIACRLDNFAQTQFPRVNEIVVQCLDEYKVEIR